MPFTKVATVQEVPPGKSKQVILNRLKLALFNVAPFTPLMTPVLIAALRCGKERFRGRKSSAPGTPLASI
jgi:hypothetical protein